MRNMRVIIAGIAIFSFFCNFSRGDEDRAIREVDQPTRKMAEKQMRRDKPKTVEIEVEDEREEKAEKPGEEAKKCVCCHESGLI